MSRSTAPPAGPPYQPAGPPGALDTFWHLVTRFDAHRVNRWIGLRNAFGVALPAAIAVDLGHPNLAVVAGMGALNVAAADGTDSYRGRATRMLTSTALGAAAIFLGSATGHEASIAAVVTALWAFASGMLVCLGSDAADIGMLSLVSLFIYIARPVSLDQAAWAGLIALVAGLFQTALSVLPWPLGKFGPERRGLSGLYTALAHAAVAEPNPYGAPPATQESSAAQELLNSLPRGHDVESERIYLLASQGERIRLTLLSLTRIAGRLNRMEGGAAAAAVVGRVQEAAAQVLTAVAARLQDRPADASAPDRLAELQSAAAALGVGDAGAVANLLPMVRDARSHTNALAGQLRAALDVVQRVTPDGEIAFAQREALMPWRLQLGSRLATLRANLSLDSSACRHAIRLTACIAAGTAIAHAFSMQRSYWLGMTIALVLKPDFGSTFSRGALRLAGTFAGLVLATALYHALPASPPVHVLGIGVLVFAQRWVGRANYGILVVAVSAVVVFMLALTGVPPGDVVGARALNTTVGGALALAVYWIWPTRERTQAPQALARMLDAYRLYFQGVSHAYQQQLHMAPLELDRLRSDARRARSNAETSADRLGAEPGVDARILRQLNAMLASSHRFIHAVMSLEAGLARSRSTPARDEFRLLSHDIEKTLFFLSARLGGSPVAPDELPDLREQHNRLVHSGDMLNERYALVNVETDRMTNSLNTLSEQVFQWTGND